MTQMTQNGNVITRQKKRTSEICVRLVAQCGTAIIRDYKKISSYLKKKLQKYLVGVFSNALQVFL